MRIKINSEVHRGSKRHSTLFTIVLIIMLMPTMAYASSCVECHKEPKFFVQNKKVYKYYKHWLLSPHEAAGLSCEQCHGGNPNTYDKEQAHMDIMRPSNPKSLIHFKNQPETCGNCHFDVANQFAKSKHYKALMKARNAPTCSTCHRSMNLKPYYRRVVAITCRKCHNVNKVNTVPLVSERALEILDRLNISKGYLGWTTVFYEERNWPGDSRREIDDYWSDYHKILANGHSFDLLQADQESIDLLTRIKIAFREAWSQKKSRP